MAHGKPEVVFYHSAICPRCRLSGLALSRALRKHPDVVVEKVEFLTNRSRAREDGVRSIPTLVAADRVLTGFVLTRDKVERFLQSLA